MLFRHKGETRSVKEPVTPAVSSIDKVLIFQFSGDQIGL